MVGGEDQGGPAGVPGHGLDSLPEVGQEAVAEVGRLQVQVVAPPVRPVVGLAQADIKDSGTSPLPEDRPGRNFQQIRPNRSDPKMDCIPFGSTADPQ